MTEYKKLCALVSQLREEVTLLNRNFAAGDEEDAEALHALSVSIQTLVANARPRLLKIFRKATETDPNRQIYNEAMCAAIKQLLEDMCEVVGCLFGGLVKEMLLSEDKLSLEECPSIAWAENAYSQHLLRRAQTEAWQKRLATNFSDLFLFETETRAVYGAEEKQSRETLMQAKQTDKTSIQQMLKAREAAKWEAEVQRRSDEHRRLMEASSHCGVDGIEAVLLRVPEPFRKVLAGNMLQLVRALRTTPEDPNIRRIRCNNMRVMMEYSHVAFCSGCQTCQEFVAAAEVLWYMLGYHVEYSTAPTSSLGAIIGNSPPILLPCGAHASEHALAVIGFEEYSERFFTLREPDPMREPSEWMSWYATLEAVVGCLEDTLA
ncbi:putative membrane associated protein [Trypanosoma conorhini]|uniref:Putative membrane associated protein n=1 Tax=Trypanosoma conorhini TaxID=83891 RepID=A0A3R7RXE2_9TRYP|nr:putative membrane associated protein [Trypanosoma conorhini]RNF15130.1 putative membrane associated protein [Trypanosoma conorhini]